MSSNDDAAPSAESNEQSPLTAIEFGAQLDEEYRQGFASIELTDEMDYRHQLSMCEDNILYYEDIMPRYDSMTGEMDLALAFLYGCRDALRIVVDAKPF